MSVTPSIYLHDGRAIIRNCLLPIAIHQQEIAAVRTKCSFDRSLNSETSVDIGDDLSLALGLIGACIFISLDVGKSFHDEPSFRTMMVGVCPPNAAIIFDSVGKSWGKTTHEGKSEVLGRSSSSTKWVGQ